MRAIGVLVGLVAMSACGCSRAPDGLMAAAMDRAALQPARSGAAPAGARPAEAHADGVDLAAGETLGEDGQPVACDVRPADATWLALGLALAQDAQQANGLSPASGPASQPATAQAAERTYVPWRQRHGPAYPGDFWTSFGRWAKEMPATLWDDTVATATNPVSLAGIAAAGAAGIVINASGSDNRVADHYTQHGPQLNKFWDQVGDVGGNPGTHFAVAGAMYFTSLARMDAENYEKSATLMNALAVNGLSSLALKAMVRTRSPNGDPWGWPSGHTSSSFTFATVIYEEYGPWVGLPAMAFATYVGYERIDARNHDFSDVISGALLGMAIGHAVAQNHRPRVMGFDVVPYVEPSRDTIGVMFTKSW